MYNLSIQLAMAILCNMDIVEINIFGAFILKKCHYFWNKSGPLVTEPTLSLILEDLCWYRYLEGNLILDEDLLGNHEGACLEVIGYFSFDEVAVALSTTGFEVVLDSNELDLVEIVACKGSSTWRRGTSFGLYIRKGNGTSIWSGGSAADSCHFNGLKEEPFPLIVLEAVCFLLTIVEILSKIFKQIANHNYGENQ